MRYAARVEYDGTEFSGFQVQPGGRTVQGELERALSRLNGGKRIRVDAAGRTDAGVHAQGQVVAFSYSGRLSRRELGRALEALLPPDIAIGRCDGWLRGSGLATRRCSASTATPSGTGLAARSGSGTRWVSGSPWTFRPCRRPRRPSSEDMISPPSAERIDNRSGPFTGCGSAGRVERSRSTWPETPSCARWYGASWPLSCASGAGRRPPKTWRPRCGRRNGPSPGRSLRRRD